MVNKIYEYIEEMFKNSVQTEEIRQKKEQLYDKMNSVYKRELENGMSEEVAFAVAKGVAEGSNGEQNPFSRRQNDNPPFSQNPDENKKAENAYSSLNGSYVPPQNQNPSSFVPAYVIEARKKFENTVFGEKRPYSSSWLKALAVCLLILMPLANNLMFANFFSEAIPGFMITASVFIFIFDAIRLKYRDKGINIALLRAFGVAAIVSTTFVSVFIEKILILTGISDNAIFGLLGVISDLFLIGGGVALLVASKGARKRYFENNGKIHKKYSNNYGWIIILVSILICVGILITCNFIGSDLNIKIHDFAGNVEEKIENNKPVINNSFKTDKNELDIGKNTEISVKWVKGNVEIKTGNDSQVAFFEVVDGKEQKSEENIGYSIKGNEITVGQINSLEEVNAVIYLPKTLTELEIDASASSVNITGISLDELAINDTAGNIDFTGRVNEIEINDVSGKVKLDLDICPKDTEYNSVNGQFEMIIPENSAVKIEKNSFSGEYFGEIKSDKTAENEIEINSFSGKIKISAK